jgi:hypothetical protein
MDFSVLIFSFYMRPDMEAHNFHSATRRSLAREQEEIPKATDHYSCFPSPSSATPTSPRCLESDAMCWSFRRLAVFREEAGGKDLTADWAIVLLNFLRLLCLDRGVFLHLVLHGELLQLLFPSLLQSRLVRLLHGEEHRTHLRQPFPLHGSHARHILLRGHDQLVVDHVVWGVTQTKEGRGGVQVGGDAGEHVDVLPDALDASAVVEIRRGDGFADKIPRASTGAVGHALCLHDVQELRVDLASLLHGFGMNKVLSAPGGGVALLLPLDEDIQESQMVALRNEEFLTSCVRFLFAVLRDGTGQEGGSGEGGNLWSEEDSWNRDHRDDDQDFL